MADKFSLFFSLLWCYVAFGNLFSAAKIPNLAAQIAALQAAKAPPLPVIDQSILQALGLPFLTGGKAWLCPSDIVALLSALGMLGGGSQGAGAPASASNDAVAAAAGIAGLLSRLGAPGAPPPDPCEAFSKKMESLVAENLARARGEVPAEKPATTFGGTESQESVSTPASREEGIESDGSASGKTGSSSEEATTVEPRMSKASDVEQGLQANVSRAVVHDRPQGGQVGGSHSVPKSSTLPEAESVAGFPIVEYPVIQVGYKGSFFLFFYFPSLIITLFVISCSRTISSSRASASSP